MRTYSLEWFKEKKFIYGNAWKIISMPMGTQDSLEATFLKAVTILGEHFNEIAEEGVTYEITFNFNGINFSVFGIQEDCEDYGGYDFTYYFAAYGVIMKSYGHEMTDYEEIAQVSCKNFKELVLHNYVFVQ